MDTFQNYTIVNPLSPENDTWAVCYLRKDGDEKNLLKLDRRFLTVVKNGKTQKFHLNELRSASKNHRKLLLPIILGGIISPFALLVIYQNVFPPLLVMTLFFIGLLLLYLGWTGSDILSIHMENDKEEQIFIRVLPDQVLKFMNFLNIFISKGQNKNEQLKFYHLRNPKSDSQNPDTTKPGGKDYILLTKEEYEKIRPNIDDKTEIVLVDPVRLSSPIQLTWYPDGTSHFSVKSINPESIIRESSENPG